MIAKRMNLTQFAEYIATRRCFCFGCGLQGVRIINMMESWGCCDRLICFTDNNPEKIGGAVTNGRLSYPIVPLNEWIAMLRPDDVIMISCADVTTICSQLDQYEALEQIDCVNLGEMGLQQLIVSEYNGVVREYQEAVIPKVLHYFWLGGPMPDLMKRNIEKWEKMCPDYEIREWNDRNYDISQNLYMQQAYEQKKWGFVPDYARLDIIYREGGIYMDTDVEMVKRPDELLCQQCFGISDCSFFLNFGAGFGAKPGMPILKELRDYYDTVRFVGEDGALNLQPTQYHTYQVMRKHGYQVNDRLQTIEGMHIYPMIMAGTNAYTMQMRITEQTFFLHYGTSTWLDKTYLQEKQSLCRSNQDCADVVAYGL